ncbi:MAG TPA: ethanolamine ammonia-lyase subunit EutC [Bryobacteraceae bacterium]|nr:ethanolamine ammonia-lyase subunit EutC [Bryobacteraceae bacterium]
MTGLRQFTPARVGLGRAGNSLPTRELLAFQLAHARARDAVYCPLDIGSLGFDAVHAQSAAGNRAEYLRRPDLGRRLSERSRMELAGIAGPFDVVFVVADGLSALAVHRHAAALLREILPMLNGWKIAPIVVVEQGRVAIADEIGAILQASLSVILIGERPGLTCADSLGIYMTWSPKPGRTDAERNCISNIHEAGLSTGAAASLLFMLMSQARVRRLSGLGLQGLYPPCR